MCSVNSGIPCVYPSYFLFFLFHCCWGWLPNCVLFQERTSKASILGKKHFLPWETKFPREETLWRLNKTAPRFAVDSYQEC